MGGTAVVVLMAALGFSACAREEEKADPCRGQEECGGACYPACPSGGTRAAADCRCRDRTPLPQPSGPRSRDTYCLSSRVPAGQSGTAAAFREFYFDALDSMGIGTLRHEFRWHETERAPGLLDFSDHDLRVGEAEAQGVALIGLLGYGNPWASELGAAHEDPYYPPDDPDQFAAFAGAMAARYAGRVDRWEIWNEQNAGYRFWKNETSVSGDPAAYGELLKRSAQAIRAANPEAAVSFGGLFYIPQVIMGAEQFLRESYEAHPDLGEYFDTLSYHPYSFYPPTDPPEWYEEFPELGWVVYPADETARRLRGLLMEHEGRDKPLWVTEIGWPTERAVDWATHARFLVRSHLLLLSEGVEAFCWYTFMDGDPQRDYLAPWEQFFGLFEYDEDPTDGRTANAKDIVTAWRVMANVIGDLRFAENERDRYDLPDEVYMMALTDDLAQRVVHVFWTMERQVTLALPSREGKSYRLMNFMGGSAEPIPPAEDGLLTLEAGPSPRYLLED